MGIPHWSAKSFRAECESRALRCVEELIEKGITEDRFLKAGEVLSAAQYADVVEERNIEHLCGYPLCDNLIESFSRQKFHISVKNKQVYDLTERKKFCSEICYNSSEYVLAQFPTLPLWSRPGTKQIKIEFLPASQSAAGGDSVQDQSLASEKKQSISREACKQKNLCSSAATSLPRSSSHRPSHNPLLMSELPKIDSIVEKPAPPTSATAQLLQQHLAADLEVDLERLTLEVARPPQVSQVSKLLAAFSTWTSVPALNSSSKEIPAAAPQDSRSRKDENLEEVGGASDSESKVVSGAAEGSKDPGVFLPPVDSVNVSQVQRRLFLSQLKKHLSGVCSKLGLTFHVVLPRVTATASKFRLDRHCITFRPAEWRVVVTVLLMVSCGRENTEVIQGTEVSQWLKDVKASEEDLKLMLATFPPLN